MITDILGTVSGDFKISVEHTLRPLVEAVDGLSSRRINSIVASTLTAVAFEAQKEFRVEVARVFDRPKPFTLNSTFVTRATATKLEAVVGFREFAGKGIAAGKYLQAEIHGGQRADKRFEKALRAKGILPTGYQAAPGPSAKFDAYGNQSPAQIIQILSGLRAFAEAGFLANRNYGPRKANQAEFFAIRPGQVGTTLTPGVYQRRGTGILKLMNFVKPPTYRARLDIERLVGRVVQGHFARLFEHYLAASIERLKLKG